MNDEGENEVLEDDEDNDEMTLSVFCIALIDSTSSASSPLKEDVSISCTR